MEEIYWWLSAAGESWLALMSGGIGIVMDVVGLMVQPDKKRIGLNSWIRWSALAFVFALISTIHVAYERVKAAEKIIEATQKLNDLAFAVARGSNQRSPQLTPTPASSAASPEPRYRLGKAEYGGPFKREEEGREPRMVYNTSLEIYPPKVVEYPYFDIYTDRRPEEIRIGFDGTNFLQNYGAMDGTGKLIRGHAQGLYSPDSPIQLFLSGESKITVLKVIPVERTR